MNRRLAAASIAAVLIAACASVGPSERRAERLAEFLRYAGEPVPEIRSFRMDRWELVGPNEVVLWTRVSEAYLVTVQEHCPDLEWAQRIAITTSAVNSVMARFDSIVFSRIPCRIVEIRPIDYRRMRADERAMAGN
jgi:hypothetical protein